mmetsp:Transcript_86995/g.231987  ORF Transcript_86995/g.231987 Transcript_86995/m.231987 type:complete len:92 (-) Transcript_86995:35-310(-)
MCAVLSSFERCVCHPCNLVCHPSHLVCHPAQDVYYPSQVGFHPSLRASSLKVCKILDSVLSFAVFILHIMRHPIKCVPSLTVGGVYSACHP